MSTLYMIIGVPGTGKTTLAKKIKEIYERNDRFINIRETDEYFIDPHTKEYHFDPSKLGICHKECQRAVKHDLIEKKDVICSNTNLAAWERKAYFDIAREAGSKVVIVIVDEVFGNVHGVPLEKVEAMKKRFEPVSSEEFYGIKSVTFIHKNEIENFFNQKR